MIVSDRCGRLQTPHVFGSLSAVDTAGSLSNLAAGSRMRLFGSGSGCEQWAVLKNDPPIAAYDNS